MTTNKYRRISHIIIHEWTPNQLDKKGERFNYSGPKIKVFERSTHELDRLFGDVVAFMIERKYPKGQGFSHQLLRMYFWDDIKRMAEEEANRMNGVKTDGNKVSQPAGL